MATIKNWNIQALTGYEPKTTFYTDFSIAERFGLEAILDTYNRMMKSWRDNTEYLTELVMVLNWKVWEHNERAEAFANLYYAFWERTARYAEENLKGEDLRYYYQTTD